MEIQYQRNLKNSYMVIIEPEQPLNPDGELAERMLQRQQIAGLLTWVSMEHERDMTFWYQITGMQSLSDRLQQNPMDHRLLQMLILTLMGLQEELPRHYLKPEHLLLHAEQIFVDADGAQIRLCYEPMWRQEPYEALRELMEQLLPGIDHGDKAAVALAYGLYEKCQMPNPDIWQYVREQLQADEGYVLPVAEPSGELQASIKEPMEVSAEMPFKVIEPEPVPEPARRTWFSPEIAGHVSGVTQMLHKLPEKYKKFRKKDQSHQPEPIYLFEPQEEIAVSENPTVYLGAGAHAEGRLSYQGQGAQNGFQIEGDTFLIGSRHGQADGQIEAAGISRSHARITRVEGVYYIEDLNSRNGTYLNDELLLYKQKRRLQPGDHLRFAHEEFIFY